MGIGVSLEAEIRSSIRIAVVGEHVSSTHRMHGERAGLMVFLPQGADEDTGCVELMTAQFGHQPAARAVPEPPPHQLFQSRSLHAVTERDFEQALAAAYQFNIPTLFWDPLVRAAVLGKLGRKTEARTAVQELLMLQPNFAERPDFYVGCFVHSEQVRADVLAGLRIGGCL